MVKGSIVALVTPFNADGSVNYGKLGELIEWHIANNTDAFMMVGTTGESATMTHEEDSEVCRYAVRKVNGRVPVYAGAGSNCTQTALEKSIEYEALGVDGLLLISPYYNKSNAEGMYRHFSTVADEVHTPILLYNVPGRTGCSIPVDVVARLAKHENIAGIKEASGNISYTAAIAKLVGDNFVMYSGNDDQIVPVLSLGGCGVISVLANVMPHETHQLVWDYLNGDTEKARVAQLRYLDLVNALFCEVNPIPVKEAMNMMGMGVGGYRLPLYPMSEANRNRLHAVMREAGLV